MYGNPATYFSLAADEIEKLRLALEALRREHPKLYAKIAAQVVQNVCELPDYSSPDDQPELLMCTATELHNCVMQALEGSQSSERQS